MDEQINENWKMIKQIVTLFIVLQSITEVCKNYSIKESMKWKILKSDVIQMTTVKLWVKCRNS